MYYRGAGIWGALIESMNQTMVSDSATQLRNQSQMAWISNLSNVTRAIFLAVHTFCVKKSACGALYVPYLSTFMVS